MKTDTSHPVVTCAQAVELEQKLLRGESEREWNAMMRAGRKLGRALLEDYCEIGELPERLRILIVAGKGHNAGDAFLAVREVLAVRPKATVEAVFALGESALNPLARRAWTALLAEAEGAVAVASWQERRGGRYHILLDGLFGMNFRPPFRAPLDEIVQWANGELEADLRAAVDLPSGLNDEAAELAVRADFTYMTGSAKSPCLEPENARWTGRLRYLDLGFFSEESVPELSRRVLLPEILQPLGRLRNPMTHKRAYGHLLLVGGSRSTPGAILMSAMAAARSGVGLLTAAVPESLVPAFAAIVPEAMWTGCPETEEGGLGLDSLYAVSRVLPKATAVLMGPGVGVEAETQAFLEELTRKIEVPLVIDAEGLQAKLIQDLGSREAMRGNVVLTPHAGEYLRISGRNFSESGEEGLLAFCRETGLLTLLKGPPFTRICDGERIGYALAGGPVLARGGSGDLLAGIAGSLVAREPERLWEAVCRAVVWQGAAAELLARRFGHEAVRTTQLLDCLSAALRESRDEAGG